VLYGKETEGISKEMLPLYAFWGGWLRCLNDRGIEIEQIVRVPRHFFSEELVSSDQGAAKKQ
jgi:hypothetical protein